jgi:protein-S-isoprenylcysteine O-methyltransferase Ste14
MTVSPERAAGGLWLIWLVCWLAAAVSSDRSVKAAADYDRYASRVPMLIPFL